LREFFWRSDIGREAPGDAGGAIFFSTHYYVLGIGYVVKKPFPVLLALIRASSNDRHLSFLGSGGADDFLDAESEKVKRVWRCWFVFRCCHRTAPFAYGYTVNGLLRKR